MNKKACSNCEGTMYLGTGGWVCLSCDAFEPVGEAAKLQKRAFDDYKIKRDKLLSEIKSACEQSNSNPEEIIIDIAKRLDRLQQMREEDILRLDELEFSSRREAENDRKAL